MSFVPNQFNINICLQIIILKIKHIKVVINYQLALHHVKLCQKESLLFFICFEGAEKLQRNNIKKKIEKLEKITLPLSMRLHRNAENEEAGVVKLTSLYICNAPLYSFFATLKVTDTNRYNENVRQGKFIVCQAIDTNQSDNRKITMAMRRCGSAAMR